LTWRGRRRQYGGTGADPNPKRPARYLLLNPSKQRAGARAASAPKPCATVLVVDDDDTLRLILARALADAGYPVLTAGDGAEALGLATTLDGQLALVITDIQMPVMDGLTLAENLAHFRVPPPVLLISGFAGGHEIPGPCLTKPFQPSALLDAVAHIVSTPTK
jgi:two-component system cell cycle response regulator CpdR